MVYDTISPRPFKKDTVSSMERNVIPDFYENAAKGRLCFARLLPLTYIAITTAPCEDAMAHRMRPNIAV